MLLYLIIVSQTLAKIKFKSGSKHIGIFPEQISQWQWIAEKLKTENSKPVLSLLNGLKIPNSLNVLNLFGYTGIASLVAARAGARITHVDASKASIDWARENQKLSELEDAPIRWILDDVLKFINKENSIGLTVFNSDVTKLVPIKKFNYMQLTSFCKLKDSALFDTALA